MKEMVNQIGKVQSVDTGGAIIKVSNETLLNSVQINQIVQIRSTKLNERIIGLISKIMRRAVMDKTDKFSEPETVTENLLKSIVTSLAGTAGATFAGRTIVSNLLKMIPGVGTALGGTISGATAAVLTTALGEAYIAIMKMIAKGEITEKDLETKTVQDKLQNIFKDKIKK